MSLLYHTFRDKSRRESCISQMKSCYARWNPSKLGWNLRRVASDEIKSALTIPTKSDFIAKRFHLTQVGFLPPSADLVEKSTHCLGRQMCAFFWRRERDSNPRKLSFQRFSRPPQSTTLPSLHILLCVFYDRFAFLRRRSNYACVDLIATYIICKPGGNVNRFYWILVKYLRPESDFGA